ncbi:hypothetical protein [Ovoidimarina sediminis]|uniref:hypothetical protein n=1 Tax=Ovoidimarina sediminis TaxID=3079856 RepID=UPI00290F044D|nr:hypothetical protein [Rhodophyticola sp. MJ-SS7]MDU8943333.1 hypothetical protein [Rhodophyticola sp. MJ-SS7]
MPKRFRLTRRFPCAMTEDGYRRLRRFAQEAGLDEGEALSFIFENFDSIMDDENLGARLRIFNSELDARKR